MFYRKCLVGCWIGAACVLGLVSHAGADGINENFEGVSEEGGGAFLIGSGTASTADWDTGLVGEGASAQTLGTTHATVSAFGSDTAGVGGSGAGVLEIVDVNFNILDEPFTTVTGSGGGVFLAGDGSTPDTFNFTLNWDDGISSEGAFAGTFGGAILVGDVEARGVLGGGLPGGSGELLVGEVDLNSGGWYAGLQWDVGTLPGAVVLANPGFEDNGGSLDGWQVFSAGFNVLPESINPHTGSAICKMFGQFTGTFNASGIFQNLPANEGQSWQIDVWTQHVTGDGLVGTSNYAVMKIEYLDGEGNVLLSDEVTVLDGGDPLDTWIDNDPLTVGPAPSGTVQVRPVIVFIQPAEGLFEGGAALFDDVSLTLVGGSGLDLSAFELTADIRGAGDVESECSGDANQDGVVDPLDSGFVQSRFGCAVGSGDLACDSADVNGDTIVDPLDVGFILARFGGCPETLLGDIQLRIEDPSGNRLVFSGTATSGWQTFGGPLSEALEADANGVPAEGVFDANAGSFRVVVAFDNNAANPWGASGGLVVDNVTLSNADSTGSDWNMSLEWQDVSLPLADPASITLAADVLGTVAGGEYTLALVGNEIVEGGLNESFSSVTGEGGGSFLSADDVSNGTFLGFTTDWDSGISGEGAFGGVYGQVEVFPGGGFSAQGLTSGGTDGSGSGEIRVADIILGPGGGWFAGLDWGNQTLASTDLSQVVLEADIRGSSASGGGLGDYELRLEDAQGDRLYFSGTSNGNWQSVGGTLDTAQEGPALSGAGDGVFNMDSPTYTVALAFFNEASSWEFGGVLEIDNLFLTAATSTNELGRISFTGVANGSYQSIGGQLTEGLSTFGDFSEPFDTVTGTGAGNPMPGADATTWDDGIEGERAFFGKFGNSTIIEGATASGCLSCGTDGGGAGQLVVKNVQLGPGAPGAVGWFAGVYWPDVPIAISEDLSLISLTADVKGEAKVDVGGTLGKYFLRIEDDDLTVRTFELTANGTFQAVGGPLSQSVVQQIETGDGIFNTNLDSYTITLGFVGTNAGQWGSGGLLTFDDLTLTSSGLTEADSYTIKLSIENGLATWGDSASLTVDNLELSAP